LCAWEETNPLPSPVEFRYTCGIVPLSSYIILFSGVALEITLAWRLAKERLWREYPLFALFLAFVIAQGGVGFAVLRYAPSAYPVWYSRTGVAHVLLRFGLVWEIFRHTFPKESPLRQMLSKKTLVELLAIITLATCMLSAVGMLWVIQTYGRSHSMFLAMERSFGFVQAALILAILATARYYHLSLGRNLWGIAVALGAFCSLSTAASAITDFARSTFFPLWYFLSPIGFVAMLAVWTWAMWGYAPNPAPDAGALIDPAGDFGRWSEDWGRAVSTVRKVSNP
jgi:hypothetical protein